MVHPNSFYKFMLALLIAGAFIFAACTPSSRSDIAPTGTAGDVTCQEDEVAVPRKWTPGTPKPGLTWDCVHIDLYLDEVYGD